jgi:hypothetical protein
MSLDGWWLPARAPKLAKQFIVETIGRHQIPAGHLHIYADRGRVMTYQPLAFLMAGCLAHRFTRFRHANAR